MLKNESSCDKQFWIKATERWLKDEYHTAGITFYFSD